MSTANSIKIGKRRVALTQIISWQQMKYSDKPHHEKLQVVAILKSFQPQTSREIAEKSKIERTSVTRCLRQLEDENAIKVAKVDACKTTGKLVRYYSLMGHEVSVIRTLFD